MRNMETAGTVAGTVTEAHVETAKEVSICIRIRNLRAYLDLSQAAFAEPLDLSPTHIARFEQGISETSQTIIDRICEKFGVDPRCFAQSQIPGSTGAQISVGHCSSTGAQISGSAGVQISGASGSTGASGSAGTSDAEGLPAEQEVRRVSEGMPLEQAVKRVTEEEKNKEIGRRLKEAREEKGWSQNELAKRANVNQATINRVEFGAKLTEKQAVKIAEVLEIGVEWIMTGDEKKKDYSVDQRMIRWLWQHEVERREIWKKLCDSGDEE